MRVRRIVPTLLVAAGLSITLSGCSGKPENSPAIRKKFAEFDKQYEKVEELNSVVQLMGEEIRRLSEENSELRALLPEGEAVSALQKIETLESRLTKLEGVNADRVVAQLTNNKPKSQESASASNPDDKKQTTTQASAPKEEKKSTATVAAQQQVTQQKTQSQASSFKQMTNKTSSSPAQKSSAKKSASRGTYHVIKSGETMATIAQQYNMSASDLQKANRLPSGARLARGQRLFIPGK